MQSKPGVSVILSTYNQPSKVLKLVLLGYQRQSFKDFELVIADDGSTDEVKRVIEDFRKNADFNIIHVWHEDKGWRKCGIVNKAILKVSSDYIILSDVDIIPHYGFVETHVEYRQKNAVCIGRTVRFGEWFTQRITENDIISGRYEKLTWDKWLAYFCGGIRHFEKGLYIKNKFLLKFLKPNKYINLYGVFSIWKEDMLKLNGLNERITHWGVEDMEFDSRVRKLGLKRISVRWQAVCYHLYHPKGKQRYSDDLKILEETNSSESYVCKEGIVKY